MLVVGLVIGFILGYTVSNYSVHHFLINSLDISQIDDTQKVQVLILIILSSMIFSFLVFMPIKKIINGFEQIERGNIQPQYREGVFPNEDIKSAQKSSQNNIQRLQSGSNASSGSNQKI
ncbi:transmembrane protein, putative (macronuclear) [Tetrahymena thermophila SB210]|uniref:Transmembrane protein, putative n=1 Tax=Tetrahymena thermophila (strain SB210) TaxID=312017 RepID=Q23FT3_TETTS|nr:transmembrane protein, putative [Tetrahymena thermophila SB210]EAR95527.2 transmembrane protein, putative [Tetrahymena thermophila SB210]|eukprot:XP_001015772.2 transmembrane protein, putative [Tetrahymena thermophila SB210]